MPKRRGQAIVNANETAKLKKQIIEKVLSNKKNGVNSANLGALADGWLELESDPGTFSLLIEDLGCFGAQVDEIYDLEQKFDGPVYGFIFLFKWLNNHHSDRSLRNQNKLSYYSPSTIPTNTVLAAPVSHNDTNNASSNNNNGNNNNNNINIINSGQSIHDQAQHDHRLLSNPWSYVVDDTIISEIFFAKQMISNSCATHALISVLLNCDRDELDLGPTLTHLREHTKIMAPENKGYAIGNMPLIAKAHNSHASYSSLYCRDRPNQQRGLSFAIRGNQRTNLQQLQNQPETYHFVSYVPIKNRLYELDGLKNYPIDHGPLNPDEDWTEKFRRVIKQRLLENKSDKDDAMNEIRYNLMAVVPDKRVQLKAQILKHKRHLDSVRDSLRQLEKRVNSIETNNKTTSTSIDNNLDGFPNRPSSPRSNGTLTASETGSQCADSPRRSDEVETGDVEIPNPPYSPLSNDTLSASETGSICNSPSRFEDSFFFNEKGLIDKYYFIKFDKNADDTADDHAENNAGDRSSRGSIDHHREVEKLVAIADMKQLSRQLERDIETNESLLKEENDKRRKYKLDNSRRTHNYEPFIMTFLSMLAKQGKLADLIERDLGILSEETESKASKTATNRQDQPLKTPMPPLQPKAAYNNNKLKQGQQQQLEQNRPEEQEQRPLTSQSGRPIRATKSKYISTGRPRGRPKKNP